MSDAELVIDESMPSLRFRDVATDTVLASRERSAAGVVDEFTTLQNELQVGRLPTLCGSHSSVWLAVVAAAHLAVAEGADEEETMVYYLVEQIDSDTTRIIGYITIDVSMRSPPMSPRAKPTLPQKAGTSARTPTTLSPNPAT